MLVSQSSHSVRGCVCVGLVLRVLQVASVTVKAKDGSVSELATSLVVVGVGARPNVDLAQGQLKLAPVGGIQVGQLHLHSLLREIPGGGYSAFRR
jgi:thioredoxin reductase